MVLDAAHFESLPASLPRMPAGVRRAEGLPPVGPARVPAEPPRADVAAARREPIFLRY